MLFEKLLFCDSMLTKVLKKCYAIDFFASHFKIILITLLNKNNITPDLILIQEPET